MALAQDFLDELKEEAAITRLFLERVPFDKSSFKPHEKSEELGRLAIHVAEIIAWWTSCVQEEELDFIDFEPKAITTNSELLAYYDELLLEAENALSIATDAVFEKTWSMRHGEMVYFTLPKKKVMRTFCMNHLVHHRAQLGVYLRILGIAIPGAYGPSADEDYAFS
jgi:uncharacterized damage-inducible protein DinB